MFRRDNNSGRSSVRPASHGTTSATDGINGGGDVYAHSGRPSTSANGAPKIDEKTAATEPAHHHGLPLHHRKKRSKGIKADGESGRSGFHPLQFLRICFRSSCTLSAVVNVLWPLVPAAIAVHFVWRHNEQPLVVFILNYLGLIPCANLIGFAGQELARKLPKVLGVLVENFVGGVTELILFIILTILASTQQFATGFSVVKAAIMGSILANMLLCLGACFVAGGFNRKEQAFHEIMSETGSGVMLMAGIALVAPTIFSTVLENETQESVYQLATGLLNTTQNENLVLDISRATAIILLLAFVVYLVFQTTSHHSIYDDVFEFDEQNDRDRHKDLAKAKLTFTECLVAIAIGVAGVVLTAYFLVLEIDVIVETRGVSDGFMGLILVPLVEKAAEHLTAIDEAYDNQPNLVLAHILGASIQTALFNAPFIVLLSWGLNISGGNGCALLDLDFRYFEAILLILAIIVVGNFLRDGKSNYLEGSLLLFTYVIIAVCAYYIPNESTHGLACGKVEPGEESATGTTNEGPEVTGVAVATETAHAIARALLGV